jgi:hypothetical protein
LEGAGAEFMDENDGGPGVRLSGEWGHMLPRSADLVVERMRHSCLDGVRLVSDRKPTRLRVDEHALGSPEVAATHRAQ